MMLKYPAFSRLKEPHASGNTYQKGGTGKTTTSITLAAGLGRQGKRILLIDMDSQANASKVLLPDYHQVAKEQTVYTTILKREPLIVHPTAAKGVDIVPAHILLSNTDIELTTAKDHREARLKNHWPPFKTNMTTSSSIAPPPYPG